MDGSPAARITALEARITALEARIREFERSAAAFRYALNRLGDALASTQDRPTMLEAVVATSAEFVGASAAVFYGVVAGTDRLRPLASVGEADPDPAVGASAAAGDAAVVSDQAVALPIKSGGRPFGVLVLHRLATDRPFTAEDVEAITSLTRQVESAIESSFLFEEAERQSLTDGLTSLWNRRQFDLRLGGEHQRGVRFGETFSVVLLDLDQMKAVNDSRGHQAGDALLIEISQRLMSGVREVDLVARYGGDEFALILPSTGVAGAIWLAEKVRISIADEPFELGGEDWFDVTASIGVATYPHDGKTIKELVKAADSALYRAKAAGGNRVEHGC